MSFNALRSKCIGTKVKSVANSFQELFYSRHFVPHKTLCWPPPWMQIWDGGGRAKCFTGLAKPLWLWGYLPTYRGGPIKRGKKSWVIRDGWPRARDARAHLLRDTHVKYIRDGAPRRRGQCEIRPSSRPWERSFWSAGSTVSINGTQ